MDNKPYCYGNNEEHNTSMICKGCRLYIKCKNKIEKIKKNEIRIFNLVR